MASTSIHFIAPIARRLWRSRHAANALLSLVLMVLAVPCAHAQFTTRLQRVSTSQQVSVCISVPAPGGGQSSLGCNPDVFQPNLDVPAGTTVTTEGSAHWQEQTDQQPHTTDSYRIDIQSNWVMSHSHSIDTPGPDGFGRLSAGGYYFGSMNGSLLDGSNQPAADSLVSHRLLNGSSFEFDLAGGVDLRLSGRTSGTDGVSRSWLDLVSCETIICDHVSTLRVSAAETGNTSFELAGRLPRGQYLLLAWSYGEQSLATPGSSLAATWDFLLEFDNVAAPVPEPASAALALAGLAVLMMRRHGIRRGAAARGA